MLIIRVRIGDRAVAKPAVEVIGVRHVESMEEGVSLEADDAKMNFQVKVLRVVIAVKVHATSVTVNRDSRRRRSWISRLILCRTHEVWNRSLRKFD